MKVKKLLNKTIGTFPEGFVEIYDEKCIAYKRLTIPVAKKQYGDRKVNFIKGETYRNQGIVVISIKGKLRE